MGADERGPSSPGAGPPGRFPTRRRLVDLGVDQGRLDQRLDARDRALGGIALNGIVGGAILLGRVDGFGQRQDQILLGLEHRVLHGPADLEQDRRVGEVSRKALDDDIGESEAGRDLGDRPGVGLRGLKDRVQRWDGGDEDGCRKPVSCPSSARLSKKPSHSWSTKAKPATA